MDERRRRSLLSNLSANVKNSSVSQMEGKFLSDGCLKIQRSWRRWITAADDRKQVETEFYVHQKISVTVSVSLKLSSERQGRVEDREQKSRWPGSSP